MRKQTIQKDLALDIHVRAISFMGLIKSTLHSSIALSWQKNTLQQKDTEEKSTPTTKFNCESNEFMYRLNNVDPFDDFNDLEEWSCDINEFMDGLYCLFPSDLVDDLQQLLLILCMVKKLFFPLR